MFQFLQIIEMFINTGIISIFFIATLIVAEEECPGPAGSRGERDRKKHLP